MRLTWLLLRAVALALAFASILLAIPLAIDLYMVCIAGFQAGDLIFPDTRLLPVTHSSVGLLVVMLLLTIAYWTDRISVNKLRALS